MVRTTRSALLSALSRILRPLVRVLLRAGIPLGSFVDAAKRAYVEVAHQEFAIPGRKPSVSRVAVITGMTRKEVSRLLNEESPGASEETVERYHRAARVVSGWLRDETFQETSTPGGGPAPRDLEFDEGTGSFSELARRFSGDVPARAILDELVQAGAVRQLEDGRLRLVTRGYVPFSAEDQGFELFGEDVADLIRTIDYNLTHDRAERFLQRKVAYDNVPEEVLVEIREEARRQGQQLVERMDRLLAARDRDTTPASDGTGVHRCVLGVYYRDAPSEES